MTRENIKSPTIANAIIWAALILVTSYLTQGLEKDIQSSLLMLHIAGWFVTDGLLSKRNNNCFWRKKTADNEANLED